MHELLDGPNAVKKERYVCRVFFWKAEDNTFLDEKLVFEIFPRFSNTQTCLNKQTMS
jgi:hypothetical protein